MKTLLPLLLTLSLYAGCGDSGPKLFHVTGTVSFSGKPLNEGTITFEDSSTGVADAFKIDADGKYAASIPQGAYGVSIQPPMITVADTAKSEGGDEFKKVDNIPNRYWSSYESGLKVDVAGDTTFDVNMVKGRK